MDKAKFRFAGRKDTALIMEFIKGLAEYEKAPDLVVVTEELIEEWIFDKERAEVLFVEADDRAVGFALFFETFATYPGKGGIYVDDLFVKPEWRGKGYGKALFQELARIAVERGNVRIEWLCLNWNQPSIDFYLAAGGKPMDTCTTYRMEGPALFRLAEKKQEKL